MWRRMEFCCREYEVTIVQSHPVCRSQVADSGKERVHLIRRSRQEMYPTKDRSRLPADFQL
jgi:hypothetical protein